MLDSTVRHKSYIKLNGWFLIFQCLLWGLVPVFLSLYFVKVEKIEDIFVSPGLDSLKFFLFSVLFATLEWIVVSFFARMAYPLKWRKEIELDGIIFEYLHELKNDYSDPVVIVTCKNRKVYVGILVDADLNSNLDFQEMFISIIPLKSGYREEHSLNVIFNTDYTGHLEENLDKVETEKKKQQLFIDFYENKMRLPISEIFSVASFKESLDTLSSADEGDGF